MMRNVVPRHLVLFCLAALSCLGFLEQRGFDESYRQALVHNPPGVDLRIHFQDEKTEFQIGERIPVELSFSSTTGDHYSVSKRTYDRSGRLNLDRLHIAAEDGFRDPLEAYFRATPFCFLGGGIGGQKPLGLEPYSFTLDLNEWVAFTKPGHYRLYVVSERVTRDSEINVPLEVASNLVEFQIHSQDPQWSASLLEAIREALDRPDTPEEERKIACRSLRFLGTADAGLEMARRLGTDNESCNWDDYFGIVASPHRPAIEAEMQKLLRSPDHPITSQFVRALVYLHYMVRQPSEWKDIPFVAIPEEKRRQVYRQRCDVYQDAFRDGVEALLQQISVKTGQAKAISFKSALELFPQPTTDAPPIDEGLKRSLEVALAEAPNLIPALAIDEQELLLRYRWPAIGNADLAPMLQRILKTATPESRRLADIALQRLQEIAHEEGRTLILEQIADPKPQVRFDALSRLPDETLPQLDDKMAENLEASVDGDYDTFEIHSLLIQRYATSRISERVDRIYAGPAGVWGCRPSEALLAYLLRADPDRGLERVREALLKRRHTACYKYLLMNVAQMQWSPSLEPVAVEFLNDPDPDVVSNAAWTLSLHGSAQAEPRLWERLHLWYEEWSPRADELSNQRREDPELEAGIRLGERLVGAITQGNSWLTGLSQVPRLEALSLTPNQRQSIGSLKAAWESPLVIQAFPSGDGSSNFIVAQYQTRSLSELKQKLSQFPPGTAFGWVSRLAPREEEKILPGLTSFAESHGLALQWSPHQ